MKRRSFLRLSSIASLGALVANVHRVNASNRLKKPKQSSGKIKNKPLVVSTWSHGMAANQVAWQKLGEGWECSRCG